LELEAIEPIDVVLLSHDHHSDNLDPGGREFLPRAGRVLTTAAGAIRLGGNALGMEPWSAAEVERSDGTVVTVTRGTRAARAGRKRRDHGPGDRLRADRARCRVRVRLG
jgi:L-ascorbate metabolism protein UlaG (beta-lactamase superfamily)